MIFTWSIADAFEAVAASLYWFVHVPVLGFLCLIVLAFIALCLAAATHEWWEANKFTY